MKCNRQIQLILLEMFDEIHKICMENNIHYYMVGGTMLGAVRHKGFIPWDDDIDIAMPREDYERFIDIAKKLLPEHLRIRHFKTEDKYMFLIAKVDNTNTILVEKEKKHYGNYGGVFIDVFPLDHAPSNPVKRRIIFFIIKSLKRLLTWHYEIHDFSTGRIKTIIKMATKKLTSKEKLRKSLDKFTRMYNSKDTNYIANYYGRWLEREIMEQSIMGRPRLYRFEGREFFGVEKPDKYLKRLYGDYMQLPPLNKRVSGHNIYYINLEDSYIDKENQ